MDQSESKVRVSKKIAIEKIKKYYENSTRKTVSYDDVCKLMDAKKIPKEVYDDSIVELMTEQKLLPFDDKSPDTIVLKIPPYLLVQPQEISSETLDWNKSTQEPIMVTPQEYPTNVKRNPKYEKAVAEAQALFQNMSLGQRIEQDKGTNFPFPNYQRPIAENIANLEARHAILMIPEFSGIDHKLVFEFVEKVDNIFRIVHPNQIELLNILILNKLTGDAEQLIRNQRPHNWQELRRMLLDHYATRKSVNRRIGDLINCIQGSNSVTKYASELQGICTGIRHAARDENLDITFIDSILLKAFLDGLNHDIKLIVRAQRPNNFQNALRLAVEIEAEMSPRVSKKYCKFCKRNSHNTQECRTNYRPNKSFITSENTRYENQSFTNYRNPQQRRFPRNNLRNCPRNDYISFNRNFGNQGFYRRNENSKTRSYFQNYRSKSPRYEDNRNRDNRSKGFKGNHNDNFKFNNRNDGSVNDKYNNSRFQNKNKFNENKRDVKDKNYVNLNHESTQKDAVVMGRLC